MNEYQNPKIWIVYEVKVGNQENGEKTTGIWWCIRYEGPTPCGCGLGYFCHWPLPLQIATLPYNTHLSFHPSMSAQYYYSFIIYGQSQGNRYHNSSHINKFCFLFLCYFGNGWKETTKWDFNLYSIVYGPTFSAQFHLIIL